MANRRLQKFSSWTPQPQEKSSSFDSPAIPAQAKAPTPQNIENQAFMENKHEALGLQLQAMYGTITPQGQERLTRLQAKMEAFRRGRLKSTPSTSLLDIPNLFAPRETRQPIQPKLTIGKVGDKYEQEADQVAAKVVSQINAPQPQASAQGETLQRQELPDDEEELQMQSMVQRQPGEGEMAATPDLESSIKQAKGSGQSLSPSIRQPMEQASPALEVIQLAPEPAVTQQEAGLHKSDRKTVGDNTDVTVKRGIFSTKQKIPASAVISVDEAKPVTDKDFIWVAYGGKEGYLKQEYINKGVQIGHSPLYTLQIAPDQYRIYDTTSESYITEATPHQPQQIGTSTFYSLTVARNHYRIYDTATGNFIYDTATGNFINVVPQAYIDTGVQIGTSTFYSLTVAPNQFRIYDTATGDFLTEAINSQQTLQPGIMNVMRHLLDSETTTGLNIEGKKEVLEQLAHQARLPGGQLPSPQQWQQATANIQDKVRQRVDNDRTELINAGLITNAHELRSIKFSGADFHKNAQAPVFLTFETSDSDNPNPRKVVYKPSNLDIDAQLFGRENSLAQALDNTGTNISQYTILSRQDANSNDEKYGFMEFVQTDGPTTAEDLMGVYESLAANLALSYLVGLEDVHQENVLLLKNRVQIIDMEATTGVFTKRQLNGELDPNQRGFKSQLWNMALNRGIGPKLQERAAKREIQAAPATDAVVTRMNTAFRNVLGQARSEEFDTDWGSHTSALSGMTSRIVPLSTADFTTMITHAQPRRDYQTWTAYVDGAEGEWLVRQAQGSTGTSLDFVRRVMRSQGTHNALVRGEVPYYTRELNQSDRIFDEEGNQIPIAQGDISKIGQAIDTEMNQRRDEIRTAGNTDQLDAYQIFQTQMISIIRTINDNLLNTLQR